MTEAVKMPMAQIDVNADLGEGFGRWNLGNDEALLDVITSANVACGFHAGDPTIMRRVCAQAHERGVVIGAQVAYRDLVGFGRRPMVMPRAELTNDVVYQIGGLQACARAEGAEVRYVKPHGALNNVASVDVEQSAAIVDAILAVDRTLALLVVPGSQLEVQARAAKLRTVAEAFPDRAYEPDGRLRNRSLPDAVLHDVDEITRRAVRIACDREVATGAGAILSLTAQSLCLHGDNDAAVQAARSVVRALREAGVRVAPFVGPP